MTKKTSEIIIIILTGLVIVYGFIVNLLYQIKTNDVLYIVFIVIWLTLIIYYIHFIKQMLNIPNKKLNEEEK